MTITPITTAPTGAISGRPDPEPLETNDLLWIMEFGRAHADPEVRSAIRDLVEHIDWAELIIRDPSDRTRLQDARRHVQQMHSHAEHLQAMLDQGGVVGTRKQALMHALNWAIPVLQRVTSANVSRNNVPR